MIDAKDQVFYQRIKVPAPAHCPPCRQQRRLAWRNERCFYYRQCDLCDKKILSLYHADSPWPVYCNECWWSDRWDAAAFGKTYDSNKSFLEQYIALREKVPRLAIYLKNAENSEYCNHSEKLRNCYLCVDVADSEDVYYSKYILVCKNIVDSYYLGKGQLLYESFYSAGAYNSNDIFLSDETADSAFLYDCVSCKNCFMCWNLRHKQYCIENIQYAKDKYEKFIAKTDLGSYKRYTDQKNKYLNLLLNKAVKKFCNILHCENCSGDCLYRCKNVHDSYNVVRSEDCRYCYDSVGLKDCYDVYEPAFNCELQYDSHACQRGHRIKFSHVSYDMHDALYCDSCHDSSDLFGCIGLRHKQYCILNKQYSQAEYRQLAGQIIQQMTDSSDYGEFFPVDLSPYCYNETVAQEYFPLTKDQAVANGYRWRDQNEKKYQPATIKLSDHINETPDTIVSEILACENCGKNYRIILQELKFYRQQNLPIPRYCPMCRHANRMKLLNPQKLFDSNCSKCGTAIKTPYPKNSPNIVYCEKCYLEML